MKNAPHTPRKPFIVFDEWTTVNLIGEPSYERLDTKEAWEKMEREATNKKLTEQAERMVGSIGPHGEIVYAAYLTPTEVEAVMAANPPSSNMWLWFSHEKLMPCEKYALLGHRYNIRLVEMLQGGCTILVEDEEWEIQTIPCETCEGRGTLTVYGSLEVDCEECSGVGSFTRERNRQ